MKRLIFLMFIFAGFTYSCNTTSTGEQIQEKNDVIQKPKNETDMTSNNDSIKENGVVFDAPVVWSESVNGLRLGIADGKNGAILFYLQNTGSVPLTVYSHVLAGEFHFDSYKFILESLNDKKTKEMVLTKARNKSAPVYSVLKPGAALVHTANLKDWDKTLAAGTYDLFLEYSPDRWKKENCWSGKLKTGPLKYTAK